MSRLVWVNSPFNHSNEASFLPSYILFPFSLITLLYIFYGLPKIGAKGVSCVQERKEFICDSESMYWFHKDWRAPMVYQALGGLSTRTRHRLLLVRVYDLVRGYQAICMQSITDQERGWSSTACFRKVSGSVVWTQGKVRISQAEEWVSPAEERAWAKTQRGWVPRQREHPSCASLHQMLYFELVSPHSPESQVPRFLFP